MADPSIIPSSYSTAFWVLLEGAPDNDGLPIFYKARPSYEITNRGGEMVTIRGDFVVKRDRVYYEVTAKGSGSFQAGWAGRLLTVDGSANRGVGDDVYSYSVDLQNKFKLWGGPEAFAESAKYGKGKQSLHPSRRLSRIDGPCPAL
jgi:hypothetical protein